MKYAGAILLGVSAAMTGQILALRLKKRIKLLTEILLFISAVKNEIEFNRKPIISIFRENSSRNFAKSLSFITECVALTEKGKDFMTAWELSVKNDKSVFLLSSQDVQLLLSFGSQLGTTDVNGQINLCVLYQKLFEEKLKTAQNYEEHYGKIYRQSGIFIGAAIIILIL